MAGLNPQQAAFALDYVADPARNAKRAYEKHYRARGHVAESAAGRLLRNVEVGAYVAELEARVAARAEEKFNITTDWITERWRRIAEFDARKLFDRAGNLKNVLDLDDDTAYVIASVDVSLTRMQGRSQDEVIEEVAKKIRAVDKIKALEALGRHIGYFNEDKSQAPRIILSGFARPKNVPK